MPDTDVDWSALPEPPWPKTTDTVFVEVQPFRGAWVANQTDERLYRMIKGFHDAGDLLAAEGLADLRRAQNLIYPTIFNYRQGIELQLKYFLMAYGPLAEAAPNFNHHRLLDLWTKCRVIFCSLESQEHPSDRNTLDAAEAQIAEFDRIDPGSYAFRFAHDTKGGAVKLKIKEIDLANLRHVVAGLRNFLECMDYHLHDGCGVPRCEH